MTSPGHGGLRTAPYAFAEQGVAMLSSVLGSPRPSTLNIEIMRTFVRVRALAATHQDLAKRVCELEETTERLAMQHDTFSRNTRAQLKQVFDALRELMTPGATQAADRICPTGGTQETRRQAVNFFTYHLKIETDVATRHNYQTREPIRHRPATAAILLPDRGPDLVEPTPQLAPTHRGSVRTFQWLQDLGAQLLAGRKSTSTGIGRTH
ncbi:hypothetical protein [Ramlibacter sp. AN1133]|uniref:hypothetical protein n=1 Tax=Ramlibacter sp. AN1133 TaxID=3133429 RepID=UPI0030C2F800